MTLHQRRSPISFDAKPLETEHRENWSVVLEYEDQRDGPWLVDLSHRLKIDLQNGKIDELKSWGIEIPKVPGQSVFSEGMLINRMNRTQISAWYLGKQKFELPKISSATDVTESTLLLALIGKDIFRIMEKLTPLDLMDSNKLPPFLSQGPISHVPCQVVVLRRSNDSSAILWTCSRGYGHDMVHAILRAGEEYGIRPAGENLFSNLIDERHLLPFLESSAVQPA